MLSKTADILTVIGFIITILTLLITISVRRKVGLAIDKNQFIDARNGYITKLRLFGNKINTEEIPYDEIMQNLREIYSLINEICGYSIWGKKELETLEQFKKSTEYKLREIESYKRKKFNQWICPYCGMSVTLESKKWVCPYCRKNGVRCIENSVITPKFKNDYYPELCEIITLLEKANLA